MADPPIASFARLANGDDGRQRLIVGQATKLSRTMHDIRYRGHRDQFFVTNPFAQAILTFRGANGQEPPTRIIQGPAPAGHPGRARNRRVHNEILVPQRDDILVYRIDSSGDAAPIRVLHGGPRNGWRSASGGIAVDPVHNVVVVAGTILSQGSVWHSPYGDNRESLLIFDRLANGDVKPLRVIRGPRTGMHAIRQMQIYPQAAGSSSPR